MSKRQYSDSDKANALLCLKANGGNLSRTAREMSISLSTIRDWRDGLGVVPDVAEIQKGMEIPLANRIDALIDQIVEAMPYKVDKASLRDAGATVGVLIDKSRLLRDKPTSINETTVNYTKHFGDMFQKAMDRAKLSGDLDLLDKNNQPILDEAGKRQLDPVKVAAFEPQVVDMIVEMRPEAAPYLELGKIG